ncbi:MAG: prepilin-type N-terminal cleavage/methylation domain-containing protein [bacterium]|nr:prepilin-type N-terminal cleavage/methylation domain-containing protein [bacterium]
MNNVIKNRGFTLPELIIAISIALIIMLILLLSINKMIFIMRKLSSKYYVASTTKNILNKLSNEIIKNSNFNSSQSAIFKISNNEIGFTTNKINQISSSPPSVNVETYYNYLIIERNLLRNKGQVRDYLFRVRKILYTDSNSNLVLDSGDTRIENSVNLGIMENVLNSELYFENKNANLVRISIKTDFLFRNQRSRLIFYLDVPINSK